MKKRIKQVIAHPLISGSTVIFIGSLFGNVFNFLFNVFMSRNLPSPSDYGVLASLISLMTLSALPIGAILPTLVYFSASYFAKKDLRMVRGLFFKITKPSLLVGTVIFIGYIALKENIAQFLRIQESSLIVPVAIIVYLGFISIANQALLQAKLAFTFISISNTISSFLKLLFGVLFIMLGYSVGGVMWAILIAVVIPYLASFTQLRFLFGDSVDTPKVSLKSLLLYGVPATIASFGLTSFTNADIILVKHFFTEEQAGLYSSLSLAARVIYYFSAPIGMVMFPLVVQKHAKGERYHTIFALSLLLVFVPSIGITFFYFLFPEFVVKIFTRSLSASAIIPYLGFFSLFIIVYALLSVVINFYLSIKETKVFIPVIIAAILQSVFIWFYHETFIQIIVVSFSISMLLLCVLLGYYVRNYWYGQKQ